MGRTKERRCADGLESDQITAGPGGLWYTKPDAGTIGRITTAGVVTEFVLPVRTSPSINPTYITAGPDGNLWFTAGANREIGRITPGGEVGLFTAGTTAGTTGHTPANIVSGPDGRLWFTMLAPARFGAFEPFAPTPSPPDVRTIVPSYGPTSGGTEVLITGYNVGSASQVLFGGVPATSFTVVGPGQIRAFSPANALGGVDVTVVTPSGTTAATEASRFYYSSPECGKVITQSTTLTEDIGPCHGDGVRIAADNITLDLGGHHIFGDEDPTAGNAAGVRLPNRSGVQVRNGTVRAFDAGVVIRGGASNTLTGLTLRDNIGPSSPDYAAELGDGIFIEGSSRNQVMGNTISNNGAYDGIGIYGAGSNSNRVENNVIENTVSPATGLGQGIIVNGATDGARATSITSTRVANNIIRNNASAGVSNINHVGGSIVNNTITGNGLANRLGNGIGVQVGVVWGNKPLRLLIEGNQIHGNGVDGIRVVERAGGNKILNNNAADNNAGTLVPGYDLHDFSVNCANNTWSGNTWGSAGYSPACTAAGGTGPVVAAKTSPLSPADPLAGDEAADRARPRGGGSD